MKSQFILSLVLIFGLQSTAMANVFAERKKQALNLSEAGYKLSLNIIKVSQSSPEIENFLKENLPHYVNYERKQKKVWTNISSFFATGILGSLMTFVGVKMGDSYDESMNQFHGTGYSSAALSISGTVSFSIQIGSDALKAHKGKRRALIKTLLQNDESQKILNEITRRTLIYFDIPENKKGIIKNEILKAALNSSLKKGLYEDNIVITQNEVTKAILKAKNLDGTPILNPAEVKLTEQFLAEISKELNLKKERDHEFKSEDRLVRILVDVRNLIDLGRLLYEKFPNPSLLEAIKKAESVAKEVETFNPDEA